MFSKNNWRILSGWVLQRRGCSSVVFLFGMKLLPALVTGYGEFFECFQKITGEFSLVGFSGEEVAQVVVKNNEKFSCVIQ